MAEKKIIFRERQEITPDDLNNPQIFGQDALDHVTLDGIEAGRRFIGFGVSAQTATVVRVAMGRLYFDGKVYFRDEPDGVAIDLNNLRPNLQKKIVAIVAWPDTKLEAEQERDFEVDAQSQKFVAEPVAMEEWRYARLEAVPGQEAVAPTAPNIDTTAVTVALVLMGPGGIETITRNDAKVLRNLSLVADDVDALKAFREETEPQVSTIKTDLARIGADLEQGGDKELLLQIAGDMAQVKAQLGLPDTYVDYRALPFLDTSASNTAAPGYAARIMEGLRFPYANSATAELALLNPNQVQAKVSQAGLLLPAYQKIERRITKGHNGDISLAEYSTQEDRGVVKLAMSRSRTRFGADFEETVGSAWWNGGTYAERANNGVRGVFQKNGETFQVQETGRVDQDGHKIVRLAKFWTDEISTPYWSRLNTEQNLFGYAHVETFLNGQDRWITELGPHMTGKPANGTMTVGACRTYRGEPDFEQILAMTTVDAADVQLINGTGVFPMIPIEPTFLKGGERIGYFIVTQHPFRMGVTDAQTAALQGSTGAYFYGMNGGVWNTRPDVHLIWRDSTAVFPSAKVDIDLTPLQLAGGIQGIDILADTIRPGSTDLVYSVLINGVWRSLDEYDPAILTDLPVVAQFRATFIGTADVMPGLRLTGSQVTTSRLATVAKHVSSTKHIAAPAPKVIVKVRLRGFQSAHHTITFKVDRGPGTIETPDTVASINQPDGTIEMVATFNLAASTSDFQSIIEMTTNSAARPFVVAHEIEVAQ